METDCVAKEKQTLTIPKGHFVHKADLDCEEPYIFTAHESASFDFENNKILVPKALAYYLRTHFCGSQKYHSLIQTSARRNLQNELKSLLGI